MTLVLETLLMTKARCRYSPMDRRRSFDFTRLAGIAVLFGLFTLSLGAHRDAVAAMENDRTTVPTGTLGVETIEEIELAEEVQPEYLAFSVGIQSGAYDIADDPASRDRDYTARTSKKSVEPDTEFDAFANYVPPEHGTLNPGLYGTAFGVEDCSFELRRVMRTRTEKVVGQDFLNEGRLLVTINEIEPDRFVSAPSCGDWVPWSPVSDPLDTAGNGDYWIGDLQPGTWEVPIGCIWEKVVGFRGASLWDVEDSARGPVALIVDEDTLGVRIRGCGAPLTLS